MTQKKMTYAEMLAATDPEQLQTPPAESDVYQAGLARFTEFFSDMTPERVRETIEAVYAPNAILHDTVVTHQGMAEIKPYFIKTAERAKGVNVTIDAVIPDAQETYVRWTMDITWQKINDGKTTRSVGISHLRFDADGRVALHHDFWDSATGLYEHIPVLGSLLKWIRGKMAKA